MEHETLANKALERHALLIAMWFFWVKFGVRLWLWLSMPSSFVPYLHHVE